MRRILREIRCFTCIAKPILQYNIMQCEMNAITIHISHLSCQQNQQEDQNERRGIDVPKLLAPSISVGTGQEYTSASKLKETKTQKTRHNKKCRQYMYSQHSLEKKREKKKKLLVLFVVLPCLAGHCQR